MFSPIDFGNLFTGQGSCCGFDSVVDFKELLPFKAIEQHTAERPVEVVLQSLDDFFQHVSVGAAWPALRPFERGVVIQDGQCRRLRRHACQLQVLGNILPVVDQDGLQFVGNGDTD